MTRYNLFSLLILVFALFVIYFFYNKSRSGIVLYGRAIFSESDDLKVAVPYWVANQVEKGNKEKSAFGGTTAEVIEVESYEGGSHGKHLVLELKLFVQKDREDNYFYKGQSLELNKWVNFNFGKFKHRGFITYLSLKPSKFKKKQVLLTVAKDNELPFIAKEFKPNDVMLNNKGEVMAKIISVNLVPTTLNTEARSNVEISVEVTAKDIYGIDYFTEISKIKTGENINLFFKNVILWDGLITSVEEKS